MNRGARLKEWRTAVSESFEEPLVGCDHEGAQTSFYMCKVFLREGGNPRQWAARIFLPGVWNSLPISEFPRGHLLYRCDVACS